MALPLRILSGEGDASPRVPRKPAWLRMKMPAGEGYSRLMNLVTEQRLHTVCQSAKCPNLGECWSAGTATLMILGDICTRSCGFCNIATGKPPTLDVDEPVRVGAAVAAMRLRHVVITSVNRDELPDGGAQIWAHTIREIRRQSPGTNVEVLIPDFCGKWEALQVVLDERPEILGHNLETVPRLYHAVRPQAKYHRSLKLLQIAKEQGLVSKTGLMLGLGEQAEEIEAVMDDLVGVSCEILTLGQYLQPSPRHLGDGLAHLGVGLDVAQAVVVHDAEVALRNASAIALGTSASASTTSARFSACLAMFSCSWATARRAALLGLGLGDGACRPRPGRPELGADVLADVDVGDVDREDLERRVGVEPLSSTALEMWSGFSSTSLWSSAEPIAVTMPSPTRAMIVSSVAPPTSRSMFVRTVTRAFTLS
jgi:lipoyl synthase